MKTNIKLSPNCRKGFSMIVTVVGVAVLTLGLMSIAFRATSRSLDTQRQVQLRVDYDAREQAFLRALVTLVPVYSANTMMDNSQLPRFSQNVSFQDLYTQAGILANMDEGLSPTVANDLGIDLSVVRSANVADTMRSSASEFVGGYDDGRFDTDGAFSNTDTGAYPPPMYVRGLAGSGLSGRANSTDANSRTFALLNPLLSSAITYDTSVAVDPGLQADNNTYPLFNLVDYPDIQFGYGKAGEPIVGKHNWWKIYMHPETNDAANTGIFRENQAGVRGFTSREYVLSIMELPAQLAISASAVAQIGVDSTGAAWENYTITGGIYADELTAVGSTNVDSIASRRKVDVTASGGSIGTTDAFVASSAVGRDEFEANSKAFYPISTSSDTARSMFVSINRGDAFVDRFATAGFVENPNTASRMSYESWNSYSLGCNQCAMQLDVIGVQSDVVQEPTLLRFSYFSGGVRVPIDIPLPMTGPHTPFEYEDLKDKEGVERDALKVNIEEMRAWMATLTADVPDGFDINHSLVINADYTQTDVAKPTFGPTSPNTDMIVVLDGTEDFTAFPRGFSIVTNYRTYLIDDVNQVLQPNIQVGLSERIFPPFSLFCPERRFGLDGSQTAVDFEGSIGSFSESNTTLDFKLGGLNEVDASKITANLKPISHPAELPPVNMVNWLVVVQRRSN